MIKQVNQYLEQLINSKETKECAIIIYGLDKFISKLDDPNLFDMLLENVKKYEHASVIIVDDALKLKKYNYEIWFTNYFNVNEGIWIGRGLSDQNLLYIGSVTKDMTKNYKNDMGYYISEGLGTLCRLIDFVTEDKNEK